jgi:hypothetical protein
VTGVFADRHETDQHAVVASSRKRTSRRHFGIGTGLAIATVRVTPTRRPSERAHDMVERIVTPAVSRWRPLALGAALGYVTLLIVTRWAGLRRRGHLGAERNGFHPELFL